MNRLLVTLIAAMAAATALANEPTGTEPPPLPAYVFDDLAPPPDAFDQTPLFPADVVNPQFAQPSNADAGAEAEANRAAALRQEAAVLSRIPEPRESQSGFGGNAGNNASIRLQQQIRTLSDHLRHSTAQQPEAAPTPLPEPEPAPADEAVPPWVKALFDE
ncbi:MAG: hypothetical protein AAFY69_06770 [Pseudomonadota bacterium]